MQMRMQKQLLPKKETRMFIMLHLFRHMLYQTVQNLEFRVWNMRRVPEMKVSLLFQLYCSPGRASVCGRTKRRCLVSSNISSSVC